MTLEEGDIVLCTVDWIVGTTVFVHISDSGKDLEGSIVFSEVAPGRIRNIRDYVVPKKMIVCKILRISGSHIDLSLRRVTLKEQKEVKERYKQERSFISILKTVLGEKVEDVFEKISEKGTYNFIQEIKENPKKLEALVGLNNGKKVLEILNAQKQKKQVIKKEIFLKSSEPNGIEIIKSILGNVKDAEVMYISAGKYSLKREDPDLKQADQKLREILDTIEKTAKKSGADFSIIKK